MSEIVERELWDHYSELPNPAWYEYKNEQLKKSKMKDKQLAKWADVILIAPCTAESLSAERILPEQGKH